MCSRWSVQDCLWQCTLTCAALACCLLATFSILYSLLIFIVTAELTKDADHFHRDNQPYVGGREVASSVPGWRFRKPICLCFSFWFVAAFLFRLGGYVSFCWLFLLLFSVNPMGCLFLFLVFYLTDAFNFTITHYFIWFICPSLKNLKKLCIIFSRNVITLSVIFGFF